MSIKQIIKKCIRSIAHILVATSVGRKVYEQLVETGMCINVPVKYCGVEMVFASPNMLTRYRSESFSYKEPETLTWLESIPEDAVFWDVGANVGLYSVYAAKRRSVRVFAFEPSVFNLELLARNLFLNDLQERVTIVPVALSDMLGPSLFSMSSTVWGGALSTFGQNFDQHGGKLNSIFEYQTMGMTMDEAVRLFNIPTPRFIKIDVDGLEHFVLRGATETLKTVESVMVEIDDSFVEQANEAGRLLRSAGLTLLRKCGGDAGTQYNQWWIRSSYSF